MALPISVEEILFSGNVEDERIEYKTGGVLESIIHTICAFANDIENNDGGYIFLGIKAINGKPVYPPVGIEEDKLDSLQQRLLELCHMIEPFYFPSLEICTVQGKKVLALYVHSGEERPYQARISIPERKEGMKTSKEKAVYIRRGSSTVVASLEEIRELYDLASRTSFDERDNPYGEIADISREKMIGHLQRTHSTLYSLSASMTTQEIAKAMRLVGGVKDNPMPKNVGLLMFSDKTAEFFPYAYIELIDLPDATGKGMKEKTFKGPIQTQLEEALNYIQSNWLESKLFKAEAKKQSILIYNYPYRAIKEFLANAVYHKDYRIEEPITVTKTKEAIEIKSFPGLARQYSDKDIRELNLKSVGDYRNRRIGEFLKELRLTEGRNTGLPTAIVALKENLSPLPVYLQVPERLSTIVRIYAQKEFVVDGTEISYRTSKKRTREEISMAILMELSSKDCSGRELARKLGSSNVSLTMKICLTELEKQGRIRKISNGKYTRYQLVRN